MFRLGGLESRSYDGYPGPVLLGTPTPRVAEPPRPAWSPLSVSVAGLPP